MPVTPSEVNVADMVASVVPWLMNATALRPPLRSRVQISLLPDAVRLPRAPSASWLTASTSSLVSSASVQASVLSRCGLPPKISGDGSMLHRVMMVTCSLFEKLVWWLPPVHSLRGPR